MKMPAWTATALPPLPAISATCSLKGPGATGESCVAHGKTINVPPAPPSAGQITRSIHQTHRLQPHPIFAVKNQKPLERSLDRKRTQTLELEMTEAANAAEARLLAKQTQPGIHSLLEAPSHFISGLPHIPERLQREVFEKGIGLLQAKTHACFSSRMMRSTILRISSAK